MKIIKILFRIILFPLIGLAIFFGWIFDDEYGDDRLQEAKDWISGR